MRADARHNQHVTRHSREKIHIYATGYAIIFPSSIIQIPLIHAWIQLYLERA